MIAPYGPVALPGGIVAIASIALATLLATVGLLTVGRSVHRARARRRRDETSDALRSALLDRLYGADDPEWEAWVDELSGHERSVLESLLDRYLRELEGSDARSLAGLGRALGIEERARRRLRRGDHHERLDALTWFALLGSSPDPEFLERHCRAPRERAAAARVLHRSDHPPAESVALLLDEPFEPFSVFGVDTLYRIAEADPAPLFERAAADFEAWPPALRDQVLLVARHVPTVAGGADLTWVTRALSSAEERTRVEAVRALGGYGWHRDLREAVDVEALCADPSPTVRAATYRLLGEWGDPDAIDALRAAAAAEADDRARVAAAEALVDHPGSDSFSVPASLADAWSWAAANAAFDRRATDVSPRDRR